MEVSFNPMRTDRFLQKTNPRKFTSKGNERSIFPVHYFRDYSADYEDSSFHEILPEQVEPEQVEIASLETQTESMDVIDKPLPPSTPPSTPKTAVLPLKFQTVISEIQENVTNSSPIDNAPEGGGIFRSLSMYISEGSSSERSGRFSLDQKILPLTLYITAKIS